MMDFVETITMHAYRVTDEQVQGLRGAGWSDEQIAEAAYDAALFNLFVRLADTFGIEPPAMYEPGGTPQAVVKADYPAIVRTIPASAPTKDRHRPDYRGS